MPQTSPHSIISPRLTSSATGSACSRSVSAGWLHLGALSLILLVSGYCSLAYQVVWIREFRLIFGGTTGAVAAVLAVFMGGLGVGGALLGRRVEKSTSPLFFYGLIELGISLSAALTPLLLELVRGLYFETGGEAGLGYGLATLLRGAMTLVVIGLPCFLMGGTLPAAARHLQHDADPQRKVTGWLYGINIVGALAGVVLTTFVTLEQLGSGGSLWLAVILNLGIGLAALVLCRVETAGESPAGQKRDDAVTRERIGTQELEPVATGGTPSFIAATDVSVGYCYGAAFVTGLVFFVLELVWYRMSVPLTGGSVYALGMVLVVALLGLSMGGWIYASLGRWIGGRAGSIAVLAALQALVILLPYLAGDWLAWSVAWGVKQVKEAGWKETVALWFLTVGALALLPSVIAGIKFPLLLSLLGRGGGNIGRQLGNVYAWNTAGAIAGSLLGGFVLLPMLGAERLWVLSAGLCALLAAVFLHCHLRGCREAGGRRHGWARPLPLCTVILLLAVFVGVAVAPGPGAYWRHSAIGFGRVDSFPDNFAQCLQAFAISNEMILEEREGRETCVAVIESASRSLFNNGKSDGSLHGDVATNIGLALIPALLHRDGIRSAAVVGIGTGVSAGWLATFPGVEKVDLIEIEPAVIDAQGWFAAGNLDPLENPVVEVVLGDARETLATRGRNYDLIISVPSNLTRSGTCNFYTVEYYRQCARRMNDRGFFCQWIQGYDLDPLSLKQVARTMFEVFPRVELWVTNPQDFVLLGSFDEEAYDLGRVSERIGHPVYRQALLRGFLTEAPEGLFARLMVDSGTLHAAVASGVSVNTDNRNTLEFRVARQALTSDFKAVRRQLAELFGASKIEGVIEGHLSSAVRQEEWVVMHSEEVQEMTREPDERRGNIPALWMFGQRQFSRFREAWIGRPASLKAKLYMAMAASASPGTFEEEIAAIREALPAEAQLLTGLRRLQEGRPELGMEALRRGLEMQRQSGWADSMVMEFLIGRLVRLTSMMNSDELKTLFDMMERPFPSGLEHQLRNRLLLSMTRYLGDDYKRRALAIYGERVPPAGTAMAIAADLPEREDARKALARFLRRGGKLPAGFSTKREPGPGLVKARRPIGPRDQGANQPSPGPRESPGAAAR